MGGFVGSLNGAVALLGAEMAVSCCCAGPCAVQGAASPQGCLPPSRRREVGDACPHLTSWCVVAEGAEGVLLPRWK